MIDLHVHTTSSDGQYTPAEIIQKAADKNIKVIAITDHDTISGLKEAEKEGKKHGIIVVPGIEINISFPSGEFHLLGLGIKEPSTSLNNIVEKVIENRNERNRIIIEKINADGIPLTEEELKSDFPDTVIGRPHFAAELVKYGVVKTRQQAFDQYLGRGKKWYTPRICTNLDEAIIAIQESKGVPVIAHPSSEPGIINIIPDSISSISDCFGIIVTDDSMSPEIQRGDLVIAEKNSEIASGDIVAICFVSGDHHGVVLTCSVVVEETIQKICRISVGDIGTLLIHRAGVHQCLHGNHLRYCHHIVGIEQCK